MDTYEDAQLLAEQDQQREARFRDYLAMYHAFLLEPGYPRRVNSVEVLFQDMTTLSQSGRDDCNNDGEETPTSLRPRRKRSSQVSLARSLSLDSLASPGLGSGAFCITPTASGTFMSRRYSRSASKGDATPVESPKKRTFPTHSPIHEYMDVGPPPSTSPENQPADKSLAIVSTPTSNTPQHRRRPPPLPLTTPSPQLSVSPPPPIPPLEEQSSGDNYDSLYDSGPSRSSTGQGTHSPSAKSDSSSSGKGGVVGGGSHSKRPKSTNTKSWLIPAVATVVTVSAVALIAGFFYMRRKS